MKVYGGGLDGNHRACVAANSMAEVKRIFENAGRRVSASYLRDFWCETGNPTEVAIANSKPGTIFIASNLNRFREYAEYNRRE